MTETRRRIKAYQEALPVLRERVAAVALLLVMSAAMMVSASFAWVTLSTNPEVSGAATQVAANGNLEIALVSPDGSEPAASAVGDSTAAGKSVVEANLTWGNLVNLSDASYGLNKIVLRPASLNTADLGEHPFMSAVYGSDGRVETSDNINFSYCTWQSATEDQNAYFAVSNSYGVRAVSSVTVKYEGLNKDTQIYYNMLEETKKLSGQVNTLYQSMLSNDDYMNTLCTVMGLYMTARLNSSDEEYNNPDCSDHIVNLAEMFGVFYDAMQKEAEAMVSLANTQQLVKFGSSYSPYTSFEQLAAETDAERATKGVQMTGIATYAADMKTVASDYVALKQLAENKTVYGQTIYINDLKKIVDHLVVVNTVMLDGTTAIGTLGAADAAGYLSGTHDAIITEGIMSRFEQRSGYNAYLAKKTISATVKRYGITVPGQVTANVYTTYYQSGVSQFLDDLDYTEQQFANNPELSQGKPVETAGDTYGLAIDLWVRTNAYDEEGYTYLTLEGDLVRDQASGTDADGNEVGKLFSLTEEDDQGNQTVSYYYQDSNGNWFINETNDAAPNLSGKTLKAQYSAMPTGYEGENRVWEEWQRELLSPELSEYNTTQGTGSCFIFYADTPEDQTTILNLLSHMYVVFTDGGDQSFATAGFSTGENEYYSQGGKVTVPLRIVQTSYSFTNEDGERVDAVTKLVRNEATRVTALVYLNGTDLENKEALSASEIQGTLNIQFGSSVELQTIGDKDLQEAERLISATVKTESSSNELDFFTSDLSAQVELTVTGDRPASIVGYFQRELNSYQGSREDPMIFTDEDGDNVWTADYTFTAPGNYVLRSVLVDGSDWELTDAQRVTIAGFTISNLSVSRDSNLITSKQATIMTVDNSMRFDLSLAFSTDDADKLPSSVSVIFLRSDGAMVSANMVQGTSSWTGSATFTSGGTYSMQYAIIDGEHYDLGNYAKEFELYMGMRAELEAKAGTALTIPFETGNSVELQLQGRIVDNAGNSLMEQDYVFLYYSRAGGGEGMSGKMTWNAEKGYYEGSLQLVRGGTYTFSKIEVGSSNSSYNTITKAGMYPTFNAIAVEPAQYVKWNPVAQVFKLAGDTPATMTVYMTHTDAATVYAEFYDTESGKTVWSYVSTNLGLDTTTAADTMWNIQLPVDENGNSLAGNWQLKTLSLINVSDERGKIYDESNPMIINLADVTEDIPQLEVITEFYVAFPDGQQDITFGKDESGNVTATFMQEQTVSGLTLNIYYGDNKKLPYAITNATLTFSGVYEKKYGQYTTNAAPGSFTVDLTADSNSTAMNQASSVTVQNAGKYTPTLTFTMLGSTYTYQYNQIDNAPLIEVYSMAPSVAITGITPTGSISVDETTSGSMTEDVRTSTPRYGTGTGIYTTNTLHKASGTYTPFFTANEATVYYKCSHPDDATYSVWVVAWVSVPEYHNYTQPSVSIKLTNLGEGVSAELAFTDSSGTAAHLYDTQEGTTKVSYKWSADSTTCQRYVGLFGQQTLSSDSKTVAGTITANSLVVSYGSNTYTFEIPTITINNPY